MIYLSNFQRTSPHTLLGQFQINFIMQPLDRGGKKIYIFRPGHMTKMAATPIYGKNLKKSSSPEPLGRLP